VTVLGGAARELRDVIRASTATHRRLRDRVVAVLLATIGVDFICAVLAYLFEHDAQQTQIKSFGRALFWTTTQLLTVSSSLQNPITPAGEILDVIMEAYAIVVIATLAGALGAFFQKRGEEIADEEAARRRRTG
jgi:branched-subunit amino acid ABC-type transport system permease component